MILDFYKQIVKIAYKILMFPSSQLPKCEYLT